MYTDDHIAPEILSLLPSHSNQTQANSARATISVRTMREMLGIRKTDSYWLIAKQNFETIQIHGQTRIVLESFDQWYASQTRYHLVNGPSPGKDLSRHSYSIGDICRLLEISDDTVYHLIRKNHLPCTMVDFSRRIPIDAFQSWYHTQTRYRTTQDRIRDAAIEMRTITMPEMARLLGTTRGQVYSILADAVNQDIFQTVVVAGKKRITRESFERWCRLREDEKNNLRPAEIEEIHSLVRIKDNELQQAAAQIRSVVMVNGEAQKQDAEFYTPEGAAKKYDIHISIIYRWIKAKKFPVLAAGRRKLIPAQDFADWVVQYRKTNIMNHERSTYGILH